MSMHSTVTALPPVHVDDRVPARRLTGTSLLVTLLLQTSLWVIAAQALLSQQLGTTWAALRVTGVLVALTACAAVVRAASGSVPLAVVGVSVLLYVALSVPPEWLWAAMVAIPLLWWALRSSAISLNAWRRPDVWLASLLAAAIIVAVTHYIDFLVLQKLRQGLVHQDSLFHAAISAMVKTTGIASTGLHGLAPISYHVWSHELLAGLSVVSGVPVLETYAVANTVILCPLLIFAAAWAGWSLLGDDTAEGALRAWLVVCGVLLLFKVLPLESFGAWDSYFVSESYTLGLVYLLLGLPVLYQRERTGTAFLIAAGCFVLAGMAKVSLGFSGMAVAWGLLVVAPPTATRRRDAALLIAPTLLLVFLIGGTTADNLERSTDAFLWFGQIRTHAIWGYAMTQVVEGLQSGVWPEVIVWGKAVAALVLYSLAAFVLTLVVLAGRWRRLGTGVWRDTAWWLNLAALAGGLATFYYHPIGVWYLVNQSMFFALPWFAAGGVAIVAGWPSLTLRLAVAAMAFGVISMLAFESRAPLGGLFQKTSTFVADQGARGQVNPHIDALLAVRGQGLPRQAVIEPDPTFPAPEPGIWNCYQVPFAYPAVTERPWLTLIKNESDCPYRAWGYPVYFESGSRTLRAPMLPAGTEVVRLSGTAPAVPAGEWVTPVFAPAAFRTSGGGGWTVEPADVTTFAYTRIGQTMVWSFDVDSTSVADPAGVALQILLPDAAVAAQSSFTAVKVRDAAGGDRVGLAQLMAGKNEVFLYRDDQASPWAPSTNFTRVSGTLVFQIR